MRIKLLRTCVVPGHPGVRAGQVLDVKGEIGVVLVCMGRAEETTEEPEKREPVVTTKPIEIREPVVETRDPGFSAENTPALKSTKRGRSKLY